MSGGTTIVDRLNKLSGKDATTIAKALENVEETGIGGGGGYDVTTKRVEIYNNSFMTELDPIANGYPAYIEATVPQNDPNVIYVMYDGLNYVCNAKKGPIDNYYYGADEEYDAETGDSLFNFTEYPFMIFFYRENDHSAIDFMCKDSGNHTVNISMDEMEVKVTAGFVNASMLAVTGKASSEPMYKVEEWSTWYDDIIPNLWEEDDWHVFPTSNFDNGLHDILLAESSGGIEQSIWRGTFDGHDIEQAYWTRDWNVNLWKVYRLTIDENIQLQHRWKDEDPTEHYTTLVDNTNTEINLSTFGEHHLKLENNNKNIIVSPMFNEVVESLLKPSILTINIRLNSNDQVTWASHTYQDITEMLNDGSANRLVTVMDMRNGVCSTGSRIGNPDGYVFTGIGNASGNIYLYTYTIDSDNTWTVTKTQLQTV